MAMRFIDRIDRNIAMLLAIWLWCMAFPTVVGSRCVEACATTSFGFRLCVALFEKLL